jgi:putative hemolysin
MIEILVVLVCLGINSFLSAIEMALISISKTELRKLSRATDPRSQRLVKMRKNPERTLSVLQIGITLVGAVSAAVGGALANEDIVPYFISAFQLQPHWAEILAIATVVLPITYISVVIGELVPKTLALRHPLRVAQRGVNFLTVFEKIFHPAVNFLEKSTKLFLRIFFPKSKEQLAISFEHGEDTLSSGPHRQYILNILCAGEKTVGEIALPLAEVNILQEVDTNKTILTKIIKAGHTRFPVVSDPGEVLGMLHAKEFLSFLSLGDENWHQIIRKPFSLQSNENLIEALKVMQKQKIHLALIYQGEEFKGIVTLEDILEEIVGEIHPDTNNETIQKILSQRALSFHRGKK